MSVRILDCTLRDGGYINDFNFGYNQIRTIISKLSKSNIDIIECGFLSDIKYNNDFTFYNDIDKLSNIIEKKNSNIMYVAMIALGEKEIDYELIESRASDSIDGIRITFHEHEIDRGFEVANNLKAKGYSVFMQPIGTTSYTDENMIKLLNKINTLKPFAFYLVDTLGIMYKNDLLRLFYLVDHNLDKDISIGFHSHNNLQLSFSNAQELLELQIKRNIIIDTSVYGMGRGAGNLCTELLTQYINDNIEYKYDVIPILEIIDEILIPISIKYNWGYSIPYYLAAVKDCHPNYANHLLSKQTITVTQINELLDKIPNNDRTLYNKELIENIYLNYQRHFIDDILSIEKLVDIVKNKKVLLIAPGKTIETQRKLIDDFIDSNNPCVISINFIPDNINIDAVFISNLKRFSNIENIEKINKEVFITSNISVDTTSNYNILNYESLLLSNKDIIDNSGLMLIKLLSKYINNIYLAGFDGFSSNILDNYTDDTMFNNYNNEEMIIKTKLIQEELNKIKENINIEFITDTFYK